MKCKSTAQNRMPRQYQHAFTLIEMMLVLTILAILAQLGGFKTALDLFEVDNGHYPKGKSGLNDLVVKPRDASADWHQYLDNIPLDQWQHPYIYECPGRHNPNSYDLSSAGPDGQVGNEDDIFNWQTGR